MIIIGGISIRLYLAKKKLSYKIWVLLIRDFKYYVDMTFCIKTLFEGTTSKTIGEERCANTKLPRCLPLGQFLQLNDIGQTFS